MIRILKQIFRTGIATKDLTPDQPDVVMTGQKADEAALRRFAGSVCIRQVDAGSCNACELEIQAMNNPVHDSERYGIHFAASPRFCDVLLVTGPASRNMEVALKRTYNAAPEPKLVIGVGDCTLDGGVYGKTYASAGGIAEIVPVYAHIRGCPPSPDEILKGILKVLGKRWS